MNRRARERFLLHSSKKDATKYFRLLKKVTQRGGSRYKNMLKHDKVFYKKQVGGDPLTNSNSPHYGLIEIDTSDPNKLQSPLVKHLLSNRNKWDGAEGEGKLLNGKLFKTMYDVTVYRAYNSFNPYSPLGKWWTFEPIEGSVSTYRVNEEICVGWSPLDRMISGTLKRGSTIAYGGGQSVKCAHVFLPAQPDIKQVYIPNPEQAVENIQPPKIAEFHWVPVLPNSANPYALQKLPVP